jgi:hypothetical protein
MMVDGAEQRQIRGPIGLLAPYTFERNDLQLRSRSQRTWRRESVIRRRVTGPVSLPVDSVCRS